MNIQRNNSSKLTLSPCVCVSICSYVVLVGCFWWADLCVEVSIDRHRFSQQRGTCGSACASSLTAPHSHYFVLFREKRAPSRKYSSELSPSPLSKFMQNEEASHLVTTPPSCGSTAVV